MKRRGFFNKVFGVLAGVAGAKYVEYKRNEAKRKFGAALFTVPFRDITSPAPTAASGYVSVTPVSGSGTITNSITPSTSYSGIVSSTVNVQIKFNKKTGQIEYYDYNDNKIEITHTS